MSQIEWNDRLNIGVEIIDTAHKKLFSIMRRMVKLNEDPKNYRLLCQEGIKYFKSYTLQHFAEEEEYMQSVHYSGYEMHKRLHDNMREKTLPALEREVVDAEYSIESVHHFMGIFMAWLTQHIMTEDRAISGKISTRWLSGSTKDKVHALENAVVSIMQAVSGMDVHTVSECYSGEEFGKAVFCRLSYRTDGDERLFAYLGFEETLVLAAVSEMMGTTVRKIDKMSLSVVSQLSQMIMEKLGEHFQDARAYEFERTNQMSYEMVLRAFQDGYPPYSFLFHMDAGYFVFCIQP